MVKRRVWCYATGRHVEAEGEITPAGWFKPHICEHKDCPKKYAVDCLIGKIRALGGGVPPEEVVE